MFFDPDGVGSCSVEGYMVTCVGFGFLSLCRIMEEGQSGRSTESTSFCCASVLAGVHDGP